MSLLFILIFLLYQTDCDKMEDGMVTEEEILREKCPNTEFFLVRNFLYSDRIQENTDQKKLRIWKLFTQ